VVHSPLEIIFDPTNPQQRFWSYEVWRTSSGFPRAEGIEYRVEVRNNTRKTIRGVSVAIENLGNKRHTRTEFVRDRAESLDIHPGASESVRLFLQGGQDTLPEPNHHVMVKIRAIDVPELVERFSYDPARSPAFRRYS
jgi:hypothetical protein